MAGSGYAGVSTYASNISYRASGAVKAASFGDGRSLSTSYDNRMRPTSWNVASVLGYNYSYLDHSDRVNYARNLYDSTLDRSYEFDQVGALVFAHSGAEARAAFGIDGTPWGNSDGPYSHWYDYDKFGNMTFRLGWGGEVQGGAPYGGDTTLTFGYSNGKNQRDGFGFDAAGNLSYDGVYSYYYDGAGRQTYVTGGGGYAMQQTYDGDGLRGLKFENNATTYYLRSTVLGGAVVCEINENGGWSRGYVYAGNDLLAVQQGGVFWNHEDPITKSKRVTDINGNVVSRVEMDPWGADTSRSSNSAFQPQNFTTYIRDGNGQQDAMARRYSVSGRFSQPDPYGGSYNFSDPQSLNRYAYTKNDPVNRRDPMGLDDYGLGPPPPVPILVPPRGPLPVITTNTWASSGSGVGYIFGGDENFMIVLGSEVGGDIGGGPQDPLTGLNPDACGAMAEKAQEIANYAIKNAGGDFAKALPEFDRLFATVYAGHPLRTGEDARDFAAHGANTSNAFGLLGESGFYRDFQEGNARNDQTHHFVTYFSGGINNYTSALWVHRNVFEDNAADLRLGDRAEKFGLRVRKDPGYLKWIGSHIQTNVCDTKFRPVPQFKQ